MGMAKASVQATDLAPVWALARVQATALGWARVTALG